MCGGGGRGGSGKGCRKLQSAMQGNMPLHNLMPSSSLKAKTSTAKRKIRAIN